MNNGIDMVVLELVCIFITIKTMDDQQKIHPNYKKNWHNHLDLCHICRNWIKIIAHHCFESNHSIWCHFIDIFINLYLHHYMFITWVMGFECDDDVH